MDFSDILSTVDYNITSMSTARNESFASDKRGFWNILYIVIICFGIVANITMLVLLVKEKVKKTSYTVYVAAIVVNDIIYLIIVFLTTSLFACFEIDILTTSTFVCKSLPVIINSSRALHGLLVLALTTERLFHAYFLRMTKLFERRNTGIVAVFLVVCVAAFLNIHYVLHLDVFYTLSVDDAPNMIVCGIVYLYKWDQFPDYHNNIYNRVVDPLLFGCLPGLFILVGNVFVTKALCQSLGAPASTRRFSVKHWEMYVFTIMVSVMFLCIDVPVMVSHLVSAESAFDDGKNTLMLLNHSVKCLVYTIIYKRTIRMCCIRFKEMHQSEVK